MFKDGEINGVVIRAIVKHLDQRGWLMEIFRQDELTNEYHPAMGYISMTKAGVARGPHEHTEQADLFGFFGPSTFKVFMWDNRKNSPTYRNRMIVLAGADDPKSILIPPGIVHAYKNVGNEMGMVTNVPNRLYAGYERKFGVDEIRHESDPITIFQLD